MPQSFSAISKMFRSMTEKIKLWCAHIFITLQMD